MSEKSGKDKGKDKAKDKAKEKPKEKEASGPSIEWDSNASSSCCILCKATWGTFRNRRHHCRNCGRLICESCSSQRFKLAEGTNELPQRVCDTCYDMLRQKREMKIQVVQLKDRNLELMLATSMISDSLINLFYLDGSTKTIGIDETTTIQELASLACPFMSVALFEVIQNIQSVNQYKLLLPTQNVVALIDAWQQAGQPYIKIVIPLNNPNAAVNADGEFDIRQSIMDTGRASMMAKPSSLVPSAANYTPTPAKSIYKVKQSPSATSPIYLASSADLMGTSYDKNTDSKHVSTPPASPIRQKSAQNLAGAAGNSSNQPQSRSYDDSSSRNSSFSDTPSAGDVSKAASVASGANIRDIAAALVANQVKVHSLEAELADMKAQLKKSQQKYDVLHAVCFKSGQLDSSKLQMLDAFLQQQANGGSLAAAPQRYQGSGDSNTSYFTASTSTASATSYPSSYGASASSTASTTVGTGVPVERKLSKRSSFSWGAAPFTRSNTASDARRSSLMGPAEDAESSRGDGKNDGRNEGRNDDASERDVVLNDRSAFSLTRKTISVRTSIAGGNAAYVEGGSGGGRETTTPPHQQGRARTSTAGTLDASEVAGSDRPPSRNNTPSARGGDDMSESDVNTAHMGMNAQSGSMNDKILQESKSVQIMTEVLQDPGRILSLNSGALNLMVRTFFCKVGEIEGFCNRYCRLFDSVLHSSLMHSIAASDLDGSPGPLDGPGVAPTTDPKLIIHLYHMIAAMDGVYEFLTEYHEDWRAGLRTWLLRTFDECVQMPVVRPDDLKSTIYCLQRENLILSTEVLDSIQACIDTSMHRNTPHGTALSNARYRYSQPTEGGEGDIIGRGAEGQYVVGTGAAGYNSAVLIQTMDNIVTTYYSVIGDLLPTLPVEIDVFAVFQMKLTNIVKHYIKATFYQHKQIMSPPELIRMVAFYDKLAQFGDKFSKSTSPHMVKNVAEMRPDVLRQCNTAMVASLAEQMLKLFNADEPAMSADVDLLEKRNFAPSPDASALLGMDIGGGESYPSASGNGVSAGNAGTGGGSSGGLTKSASSSDLTNGYNGTGIFRCSTLWPIQLVSLLRQYLGWIPVDIDTQKKVYWCILLLDTLQEFHVKQTNWLTQGMKMNTINVGPLCKYVNNHTKFAVLLNDCIDEWGAELSEKHAIALFDKAEYTCGLFVENSSAGVEAIAQLLYAEMKDILKGSLFRSGWDDSVKCVMLLKASLHRHFTFLQQHLCSGVGAGDAANGGLEAVQQLLVYICECIVSIYIELLLTNSSLNMDLNTLSRLSEDLELITKLFEELRNKIYLSRMCLGRSPHIIESSPPKNAAHKRKLGALGIKPHLSNRKKSAEPATEDRRNRDEEVPPGRNSSSIANVEEDSKATFKKALQPLTHVILAVQMNNQYLPDFVKTELYEDFGATTLNIWQLIMYWRKESKDDIVAAYHKLFADWRAPALEEPLVDISHYMSKVKAANIVR